MTSNLISITRAATWLSLVMALGVSSLAAAGLDQNAVAEKERQLVRILQSEAPAAEKAITCKQLAIYGGKDAVAALAPLLAHEQLSSWARIALEAIPDPAADAALRQAQGQLQGRLLIGVINSIGYRRDGQAVELLALRLQDPDLAVAAAAAEALGQIGGAPAAKALSQALAKAPEALRGAVAEGSVLCAEGFLLRQQWRPAAKLYDAVRQANVPKPQQLEAIRGAILARQSGGLPLLLDQLRSADKNELNLGLRVARELPGSKITKALFAELNRLTPVRQNRLLQALGDRPDEAVAPQVVLRAKSGPKSLRLTALNLLQRSTNLVAVPVLLAVTTDPDPELAKSARTTLAMLPAPDWDANLLSRLSQATGQSRQVLIEIAAQRHVTGALPSIIRCAQDPNPEIRAAAVQAMGVMGEDPQAAVLVQMLQKNPAAERAGVEKALLAICGRSGSRCTPHLLPLTRSQDASLRLIGLRSLLATGGPEALAAVNSAVTDSEAGVQEEAVRALSSWANNWPDDTGVAEPLLALAKAAKKPSQQILAVRGYLEYLQGDKKLSLEQKAAKINEFLPLVKRLEEKRLALSVASALPTAGALELLVTAAADAAIAEEACLGIVNIVSSKNLQGVSSELRQRALQAVLEKSQNEGARKKAQGLMPAIP